MKGHLKRLQKTVFAGTCVLALLCPMTIVHADELDNMETQSSDLQSELDNVNNELLEIGGQIADNEVQMEAINGEIEKTQEQLLIAKNNEEQQYEDMKLRIQYIYENSGESMLGMIFSAESMADFINKVDFITTVNDYDRDMLTDLQTLRKNIENEEKHLKEQQQAYVDLENDLTQKEAELTAKASEASTDLASLSAKIEELKAQKAAEAARKEAEKLQANNSGNAGSSGNGGGSGSSGSSGSGKYNYPSGPGQLNPVVGVVYFNGHKETYYSQRVLPGHGLNIPGRHVADDGTIRDINNYLCLASSDHPKGTKVETSLGTGIVYDSGCASGVIDIYTDW